MKNIFTGKDTGKEKQELKELWEQFKELWQ